MVFEHLSHGGLHEDPETFNRATLDFLLRQPRDAHAAVASAPASEEEEEACPGTRSAPSPVLEVWKGSTRAGGPTWPPEARSDGDWLTLVYLYVNRRE